jgi:hypothetical protein
MSFEDLGSNLAGAVLDKVDPSASSNILDKIDAVLDKAIPDAKERNSIKLDLMNQLGSVVSNVSQNNTNADEAQSRNVFLGGFRACTGWVCALVFGLQFLVFPIATFIAGIYGHVLPVPTFPDSYSLLTGLLGLGGLRTFEKIQNVGNTH